MISGGPGSSHAYLWPHFSELARDFKVVYFDAQGYALKYQESLSHLILANTFHSGEMWQKGNNDTWNFQLANQMPELWEQLKVMRTSGHLSCSPEYQKAQGIAPATLSYFYDPSNANRPGDGPVDLNPEV